MRNLVIRAGSWTRRAMPLHGKTHHRKTREQARQRLRIPLLYLRGPSKPVAKLILHHAPRAGINRFNAQRIRQNPVSPGGNLSRQIAVAPACHFCRCIGQHIQISQHRTGRPALNGLFEPAHGKGRASGGVAVHRHCGCHTQIGSPQRERGMLHKIIDNARPNGHGNPIILRKHLAQFPGQLNRWLGLWFGWQDVVAHL